MENVVKDLAPCKRWADIDQAASYVRLAKSTLYNWVSQGKITAYKIGRRRLFDLDELDQLIITNSRPRICLS